MKITRSLPLFAGSFLVAAIGAADLAARPHDGLRRNAPARNTVAKPVRNSGSSLNVNIGVGTPGGFVQVSYGKNNYYYRRGVFYQPWLQGYRVVRPPHGCIVPVLPPQYVRVYVGGVFYYRYDDIYYRQVSNGYMVVTTPVVTTATVVNAAPAPQLAVAEALPPDAAEAAPATATPEGAQSVWVGDVEYLFKDGQFFRKTKDGLIWSEAPLGAVTRALPSDATSVWYQDVEYFECNDVYFRKTPDGYKVVAAPWKTS